MKNVHTFKRNFYKSLQDEDRHKFFGISSTNTIKEYIDLINSKEEDKDFDEEDDIIKHQYKKVAEEPNENPEGKWIISYSSTLKAKFDVFVLWFLSI